MKLLHTTTKYVFDVSDMDTVRLTDQRHTLFQPETITVSARDTTGFHSVRVHGRKVRNSWTFGYRYAIAGDRVVPDERHGDAPQWVKDAVAQAWALRIGNGPEVQPQGQATGSVTQGGEPQ